MVQLPIAAYIGSHLVQLSGEYMFIKISASGADMYLSCQRKYWHKRINKTSEDLDYKAPNYFAFGKACADIQQAVGPNPVKLMTSELIFRICQQHSLDVNQAARIMAVLRKYYGSFSQDEIFDCEKWLEHPVLVGKIDKKIRRDGKVYICEDKTASDINPALRQTLKTDNQLCLYSACAEQCEAEGIIYRVVSKPKEKRKKEESWESYTQRCTCEALELVFDFAELDVAGCLARLDVVQKEIEVKEDKELFSCNLKNCTQFYSPCPWYSQCHEKTYSETQGEW
jgi:hypothetical protein